MLTSRLLCSYMWVDDNTIGALVIPAGRGAAPEKPPIPIGPNIQDNSSGKTSQVRTHVHPLGPAFHFFSPERRLSIYFTIRRTVSLCSCLENQKYSGLRVTLTGCEACIAWHSTLSGSEATPAEEGSNYSVHGTSLFICIELALFLMILVTLQARTYPDLLKSPHDEALMEYYCQSSLVYIDVRPRISHLSLPCQSSMVDREGIVRSFRLDDMSRGSSWYRVCS